MNCMPIILGFVLKVSRVLSCSSGIQLSATLWTVACPTPLSMGSPGKNTGVGCHSLLQGIFPTQRSNSCLPDCRQIYHPSHQGSDLVPREKRDICAKAGRERTLDQNHSVGKSFSFACEFNLLFKVSITE